ncbi:MOSC domain-containing protein [Microbacterium sp. VKM Ac-2923]|uniref:MOSC domain-containing protein n=1 Tax=Microbacterium sp. VKM Ac-2923 TaxID=2929476 RepID=UPI001FB45014|nr:MOSC domain-containing protein [Microbacterium sp. VKM Ac-2923]MCJ1707458.1 MOSC domain-containing protein [Microbacterium sp. VKM Ac-2923]
MIRVDALYRYPVKGFSPERRDSLVIQDDGRVQGDRALVFRFADALEPADATFPKSRGLALMTFPTLARVRLSFDDTAHTLRLQVDDLDVTADLSDEGRARLSEAVTAYLRTTSDAKLLDADGVLPLGLLGDGATARFQDRPRGFISLHGSASVADLDAAVPAPVDDRRFRSNIVISGADAWAELDWTGRLRIGEVLFDVQKPIERCAAITANPDTGVRDARLLRVLTTEFAQDEPTLGILLLPVDGGGTVREGDEVVLDA